MALASSEARRFNHEYIGTEHLLIGLVAEGSGVGAGVLKNLGIDLQGVRAEVEKLIAPGPDRVAAGKLPQTPRAKKVIEHAIEQTLSLGHNYLGTEHLLLGLLAVTEGVAARVLARMGVKLETARREVQRLLGASAGEGAAARARPSRQYTLWSNTRPRRVLVSGASNQTGPAVALAFACTGARLVLTYHSDEAAGNRVAASCRNAGAASVDLMQLDLMDNRRCIELIGAADEAMDGLDVLVAVAAAGPSYTPLTEVDVQTFTAALQGQITGNFLLAREAGNRMKKADGGRIVLFGATSFHKYHHASYGFAKAAINELTKFLALELAPEVTVNTIVPGLIDLDSTDADLRRRRAERSPLGRIVRPNELAQMCLLLCSEAFDTVTGQTLLMDAGFFLKPAE
jgi:NAD(P)-dependent dehydrogenase (short-subunit alcohol dehydrogenase family)